MEVVMFIGLLFAVPLALVGVFSVSNATLGVGLLTAGCFLAIVARIAQAAAHHKEWKKQLTAQLAAIHAQIAEGTTTRSTAQASPTAPRSDRPVMPAPR